REEMGELPPIVEILKKVQKRKDGTYVSSRSEKIVNAYEARVAERLSQGSTSTEGSSVNSSGQLSVTECDKIYYE
ncbi:unnamed protein product, partial [Cochlearia groenlandica]